MIVATTPQTVEQRIDTGRIPPLQLPAGADPKSYFAEQLKDNNTPFYKVALNLAEMSMRGNLVKIVAPTQVIANQIAICVASLAKLLQLSTSTPHAPVPATASIASPTATYNVVQPESSDIPLPDTTTAPRYVAQQPFEGEGVALGRGYFAEKMENGTYNVWYGTGALHALANVPDLEDARKIVDGTYKQASGKMVEGHYLPADTFTAAVDAVITQMTVRAC
jgi:hypothetical protein